MRILIEIMFIASVMNDGIFGANILAIFPAPSYSHTIAAKVLTNALVERGHTVTLLTTDPRPMLHPNITQIDLSFSYKLWQDGFDFVAYKENGVDVADWVARMADIIYEVLVLQLGSSGVQNLIKQRHHLKYDAVIVEALGFLPYHAFSVIFEAPLIGFNSFDAPMEVHMVQGNFVNPFVIPDAALFPYINQLTFSERWRVLKTFAKIIWMMKIRSDYVNRYNHLIKTFFPMVDATPLELLQKIEFLMINTHPALGFVRPIAPSTIQLGFIHIEPPKELPHDLQMYLDRSKNGVIYMSLGSNVKASTLSKKFVNIFLRVFESLDYDVIWKWEANEMENQPKNVRISKWLPQRDLMDHSKVKLFITQGGHQSMEESIECEVPMLVIPFLGDQYANANRIELLKVGFQLELLEMTEENLKRKILELLKPEYKKNMHQLRDLIHDQPMTSLEKAVWWIEHITRRGTEHLQFKGKSVPIYQSYCLDFIAIFIAVAIVSIYMSWKILSKLFHSFPSFAKNKIE